MKKNRGFISVICLGVMVALSCTQNSDKTTAKPSGSSAPELLWKYESGG